MKVTEIVITGGPCSGKSTVLSILEQDLSQKGFKVIIVPETATEVISSGLTVQDLPVDVFQGLILDRSLNKEQTTREIVTYLKQSSDVVILYDRGILDCKAYIDKKSFADILQSRKIDELSIRDSYDAVLHLVTAADGAQDFYTLANNKARSESPEQARQLDIKTRNAWIGHSHLRIVDNSTCFDQKILRIKKEVYAVLGLPQPLEIERKYLIKKPSADRLSTIGAVGQSILQSYLHSDSPKVERRIRQRGSDGVFSYYYTEKTTVSDIKRFEVERKISQKEYMSLLLEAKKFVRKDRYCFVYQSQYFELDIYPQFADKAILEIELTEETQVPVLPDWVDVIADVTDDSTYRNASLATRG